MNKIINYIIGLIADIGSAICFFCEVAGNIFRGKIRGGEVLKQVYEQGINSIVIIALTSLASGAVLALQGYVAMSRFGAKEYVAHLVALSLVRELGPVFTALIFSGKAGARIAAELGSMNVNNQMLATRTLGIDPIEFLIVPRMLACFIVVPLLAVMAEVVGIAGGYFVGVFEAHVEGTFYINQTIKAVTYVDFFSGFIKVIFFGIIIGWICCYQGYNTKGGSLGVGKFTTRAVAYSYIAIILSNAILTKVILTFWG
ncbi:MAG: ABC transporter permease [Candidatus Omnitrophica bacterium]|nr:ABC transporter permease [Candidatus Omnitrophota bacterium]MBU4333670.1 ABC transporter permease [Candidatus Omnitrophota bacterium]